MALDGIDLMRYTFSRRASTTLLLFFLIFSSPIFATARDQVRQTEVHHSFQLPISSEDRLHSVKESVNHRFILRHIYHHGTYRYPGLHRKKDIPADQPLIVLSDDGHSKRAIDLRARSRLTDIQRLKDRRPSTVEHMLAAARERGQTPPSMPSAWVVDSIVGPDVTDKETVVNLAEIASNAYAFNESSSDWNDIAGGFNRSYDFGWEGDGIRGHVFADESNSTVIISIKGTTAAVFDGDGTTTNDKLNDNLFASCCCGQQGAPTWHLVCDCASSAYTCNRTCVVQALRNESRYYAAARNLYTNVTLLYPDSNVWLVGHSLGGAISSLLGLTYGLAAVTFQAVPDALAATRLGLPQPPNSIPGAHQSRSMTGVYHFGHTADPIYMGTCNSAFSFCSMAGYAFESQCHTGQRCVYDVVGDKGWSVRIGTHSIRTVIDRVLKVYDEAADCAPEPECQDCFNWNYYDSNNSVTTKTSTTSSTTRTRTRTSTCKTRGWWGCLDDTTTTTTTTTATSSSTSAATTTTTCKTSGWFGRCLDESTSTTMSASSWRPAIMTKPSKPTSVFASSNTHSPLTTTHKSNTIQRTEV